MKHVILTISLLALFFTVSAQELVLDAAKPLPPGVINNHVAIKPDGLKSVFEFNGTDAYFELPAATFPRGYTLLTWAKIDESRPNKSNTLISHSGYNNLLSIESWLSLNTNVWLQDKSPAAISSEQRLELKRWYLTAVTYDPATGELLLYLNGIEVAAKKLTQPLLANNNKVCVGVGRVDGVKDPVFLYGKLNMIRVADTPFPAEKIKEIYDRENETYR